MDERERCPGRGTHFRRTPFQTSSRTSSLIGTSCHSHDSSPTSRRWSADSSVYVSWKVGFVAPRPWKNEKRDSGPASRFGRCWKKAFSSVVRRTCHDGEKGRQQRAQARPSDRRHAPS